MGGRETYYQKLKIIIVPVLKSYHGVMKRCGYLASIIASMWTMQEQLNKKDVAI